MDKCDPIQYHFMVTTDRRPQLRLRWRERY